MREDIPDLEFGMRPELRRAIVHATSLQRAYYLSLERRVDREDWERLGRTIASALKREELEVQGAQFFDQCDENLRLLTVDLLSPKTSRARHYRKAAEQAYESAQNWGKDIDQEAAAYWRHCVLVWLTLWHFADVPHLSASDSWTCLERAFASERNADTLKSEKKSQPRPSTFRNPLSWALGK